MTAVPDFPEDLSVRKPRPNHQRTLRILQSMTAQEKLAQVFKLNERTRKLMKAGLRNRYPQLSEDELDSLYLRVKARCHNRNY